MSDNESDSTHISYTSISDGMKDVLEFKKHVDVTLKNFSDSINALSASILLYKRQLKTQHVNDSDHSSDHVKKKFCSNVNNNVDECKNNKNTKKHRTCCYSERVAKLREQKRTASLKEIKSLTLSADNNNNILDVNNNIIFACDKSSDTPTDVSTKHSRSSLVIPARSSKDKNNSDRDKKNEKDREIKIIKEKKLKTETTSNTSSNISSTTNKLPSPPKPSVPTFQEAILLYEQVLFFNGNNR
jgi:hypothetical protein